MKEMVGGCCVCSDERGWPENPLVYCDGGNCNVAVHQACYGIVSVPTGPWFCRKCESQERSARVRCELCPSRTGALKKTNTSGWAHVVCALYIPEVRFGNVTTMEPINLDSIPVERYGKTCYICQELNKGSKATMGACMQCNKTGCKQQFHVTCAQQLGLLCEEAGNYLDNVKYCGYCQHHYSKLKKGGNVKLIPPYKPITYETGSSDGPSSPEKESETTTGGHGGPSNSGAVTSGSAPSLSDGQPSSSTTMGSSNMSLGHPSGMNTAAMAKGTVPSTSGPSTSSQVGNHSSTTHSSNTSQGGGSASSSAATSSSSSSTASKSRKSSSISKGSSSTSSATNASGTPSQGQGNSVTSQSTAASSSSSGIGTGGSNSNGSSKSSSGGGGNSGTNSTSGGGSSKEYKESGKHSKGASKSTPNSKDRDTYKDKSSKSTSSSSSSAVSSSKNKESSSSSGGHHHQSSTSTSSQHSDSQSKGSEHSRNSDKSSSSSASGGSNKNVPNASILAPSVLQQATTKEATSQQQKYPYSEANNSTDTGGGGVPDAGGSFINESKLAASSSSAAAAPVVSTKKRKASDSSKLHSSAGIDEKMPLKDVSVTLIPLRQSHHDKIEVGDSKKVKSERGSPLQSGNDSSPHQHHHPVTASVPSHSPALASSSGPLLSPSSSSNLQATQTGATSISITKQPPQTQPTTTNVIIKPPVIKDIGNHLSTTSSVSSGGGGNGPASLVVSVPLSPVSAGAVPLSGGGTLGNNNSSSSASQNLFQQAIQNRSEHLNFSNTGSSSSSRASASQPNSQASLSRSSPIVAGTHHMGGDHHGGMQHHRQSPLIQSSNLGMMDNGGRSSLSPSMHQSDSGMLKVTYEKQAVHGNIVNPGAGRLAALQDDAMSSSRRSSADCGIFQSAVAGGSLPSSSTSVKGLFSGVKRQSRDYGVVTSSSAGGQDRDKTSNNPSPSNLFAHVSGGVQASASLGHPFKSASGVVTATAAGSSTSSSAAPFSSFVTSSRTPDFNSFGGGAGGGVSGGNSNSSSGGGGLKISYEPQAGLSVTTTNTTLLTPSPSPSMSQMSGPTSMASNTIGAQPMMKDSPPSSPNSEAGSSARKRTRKQQESGGGGSSNAAVSHGKVFQNGIHASHMLGNQLNPNSSVAQKMSDQLHMELEAHSVYTSENNLNLVGPLFPGKQSSAGGSSANKAGSQGQSSQGPPSLSSMLSGGSTASGGAPQSLEQLLERQWEQGSQFLMEQAQHFDIASLLSCLHQLRAENVRLEDHVNNLVARRDHLLAVNARLAIPLNQSTGGGSSGSFNPTTNGPMDPQQQQQQQHPPSNVIQRGGGGDSASGGGGSRSGGGGRGMGHGSYAMENGIDFRSAAQHQQSMMMSNAGHQGHQGGGGGQGPQGSGSSAGIVRSATSAPSSVAVSNSMVAGGVGGMSSHSSAVRVSVNSGGSNHGHPMINSSSSASSGGGGVTGVHSNGGIGGVGASLMGVVGSSLAGGPSSNTASGMVTALGMISGASRPLNAPVGGITYPVNFQQFRRDDAQMKPS